MKSAGKVAKALYRQIMKGDPHAVRLVSVTYAEPFLSHLLEHCAP